MIGNGSFNSSPDYRKWMLNQFQQNTLLLCIKKSFRRCFTFLCYLIAVIFDNGNFGQI